MTPYTSSTFDIYDKLILYYHMTTLSVPVDDKLRKFVEDEAERRCTNKADIVRYAIKRLAEEEAVERILRASREPSLSGNLRDLVDQLED